jgi:hypothetical protein
MRTSKCKCHEIHGTKVDLVCKQGIDLCKTATTHVLLGEYGTSKGWSKINERMK